jgi:hypothetical protein
MSRRFIPGLYLNLDCGLFYAICSAFVGKEKLVFYRAMYHIPGVNVRWARPVHSFLGDMETNYGFAQRFTLLQGFAENIPDENVYSIQTPVHLGVFEHIATRESIVLSQDPTSFRFLAEKRRSVINKL